MHMAFRTQVVSPGGIRIQGEEGCAYAPREVGISRQAVDGTHVGSEEKNQLNVEHSDRQTTLIETLPACMGCVPPNLTVE